MLDALAKFLDLCIRHIAPLLPGLSGGGIAWWEDLSPTCFQAFRLRNGLVLRGFGMQLVLDFERA